MSVGLWVSVLFVHFMLVSNTVAQKCLCTCVNALLALPRSICGHVGRSLGMCASVC